MKKTILILSVLLTFSSVSFAQEKKEVVHIYNPQADAQKDIDAAVHKAKSAQKNVLVQVGGNWCIWCIRFHDLVNKTPELKKTINDNFEWVLVNWSPENKNTEVLTKLGNPGRFGYPVFVVLDGDGKVLHIQDSGYLERDKEETTAEGKGHSVKKTEAFLKNWTYTAVHAPAK
eukprot:gene4617-5400_t